MLETALTERHCRPVFVSTYVHVYDVYVHAHQRIKRAIIKNSEKRKVTEHSFGRSIICMYCQYMYSGHIGRNKKRLSSYPISKRTPSNVHKKQHKQGKTTFVRNKKQNTATIMKNLQACRCAQQFQRLRIGISVLIAHEGDNIESGLGLNHPKISPSMGMKEISFGKQPQPIL
eukprot:scaffold11032_cov122-Cylindrotheca_fusiformis.AAC.17